LRTCPPRARASSSPSFITVRSIARSRAFYSEVLGGEVVLEENPCMIEVGQSTGLLAGKLAKKRPEDLPG
jgi:hypothetical protein